MSWNYRIIKNKNFYQISEVYYDPKGNINGYGDAPVPYGENKEEIKECLDLMYKSLDKRTLDIKDLEVDEELDDIITFKKELNEMVQRLGLEKENVIKIVESLYR